MAFGSFDITNIDFRTQDNVRKLIDTSYKMKAEVSISAIDPKENKKQKLLIYYSDEISSVIHVPGLPTYLTFLQGKPYSDLATDVKLFELFESHKDKTQCKINFGSSSCSFEGRIYSK